MSRHRLLPSLPIRSARGPAAIVVLSGALALGGAAPASAAQKCTTDEGTHISVCINQHASTRPGYEAVATFRNPNKGSFRIRPTLTDRKTWFYKGGSGFVLRGHQAKTIRMYHEGYTQICSGFYLSIGSKYTDSWSINLYDPICGWFTEGNY